VRYDNTNMARYKLDSMMYDPIANHDFSWYSTGLMMNVVDNVVNVK